MDSLLSDFWLHLRTRFSVPRYTLQSKHIRRALRLYYRLIALSLPFSHAEILHKKDTAHSKAIEKDIIF